MPSFVRSPYRAGAAPPSEMEPAGPQAPDRDLWPVVAVLWLASAVRIAGALWLHQVFGTEVTLALGTLVLGPCLVGHGLGARLQPWRRRPPG